MYSKCVETVRIGRTKVPPNIAVISFSGEAVANGALLRLFRAGQAGEAT
jgi:hypothetical protein